MRKALIIAIIWGLLFSGTILVRFVLRDSTANASTASSAATEREKQVKDALAVLNSRPRKTNSPLLVLTEPAVGISHSTFITAVENALRQATEQIIRSRSETT